MPETEQSSTETVESTPEAAQTETVETLKAQLRNVAKALKENNKEEASRRIRLEELEAEEAKRKQAAMTESEKAKAELGVIQAELTKLRRAELLRQVAEKVGLPAILAIRIMGETPEELEADAQELLKNVKQPDQPKQPGPTNPGGAKTGETNAERRKRLGI